MRRSLLTVPLLLLPGVAACPRLTLPGPGTLVVDSAAVLEDRERLREPGNPGGDLLAFDGDTLEVRGRGWNAGTAEVRVGGVALPGLLVRSDTVLAGRLPPGFAGGDVSVVSAEHTSAAAPRPVRRLGPGTLAATAVPRRLETAADARITAAGTAGPGKEPRGIVAVAFRFGLHELDATHVALLSATDGAALVRQLPPAAPAPRHVVTAIIPTAGGARPWFEPAVLAGTGMALQVAPDYRGPTEPPALPAWLDLDDRDATATDVLPQGLLRGLGDTFLLSDGVEVWSAAASAPGARRQLWTLGAHDQGLRWGLLRPGDDPAHSPHHDEMVAVTCDWDSGAGRYTQMQVHHVPLAADGAPAGGAFTSQWLRPGAAVCDSLDDPEGCRALRECEQDGACREALVCAVQPACAPLLACLVGSPGACVESLGCASPAECAAALDCAADAACTAGRWCNGSALCRERAQEHRCDGDAECLAWAACQEDPHCAARLRCASSAACAAAREETAGPRLAQAAGCLADGECASAARCDAAMEDGDDASWCPALTRCFANACSYRRDALVPVAPGWAIQSTPLGWNSWREVQRSSHAACPLDLSFGHVVPLAPGGVVASAVTGVGGRLLTVPVAPDSLQDVAQMWSWAPGGTQPRVAPAAAVYSALVADSQAPLAYAIPVTGGVVDVLDADGALLHSWAVLGPALAAWPGSVTTQLHVQPGPRALLVRPGAPGVLPAAQEVNHFDAVYLEQQAGHAPKAVWGRVTGSAATEFLGIPAEGPAGAAVDASAPAAGVAIGRIVVDAGPAQVMTLAAVTDDVAVLAMCGDPAAAGVPCPDDEFSPCAAGAAGEHLAGWLAAARRDVASPALDFVPGSCGANLVMQAPASPALGGAVVDARGRRMFFDQNSPDSASGFVMRAVDLSVYPPAVQPELLPDPRAAVLAPSGDLYGVFSGAGEGLLEVGRVDAQRAHRTLYRVTLESLLVAVSPDERQLYEASPGLLRSVDLETLAERNRWALPGTPRHAAVDPTGARVVVTMEAGSAVVAVE